MGYQYAGSCYSTAAEAAQARWSEASPHIGEGTVTVPEFVGGAWVLQSYAGVPLVLQSSAPLPVGGFAECSAGAALADGMAVGWLVAGAWLAVYAIRLIWKAATENEHLAS